MIKYFKNGVLEVETLDLPQDCGEIKLSVILEEERDDANYYLEFACPRNVKYISQKLTKIADKEYEIILPRGISEYIGEVYVQMLIMSNVDAVLISRSLIASNPLFVIKESILASNALDSSDRRDFFEFAQNVVTNATDKVEAVEQLIENIPNKIDGIVNEQLQVIDDKLSDYEKLLDDKYDKFTLAVNTTVNESKGNIDNNTIKITENTAKLSQIENGVNDKIGALTSNVTEVSEKVSGVESSLNSKMNKTSVKNEYVTSSDEVYSAQYINSNFKKMHKDNGELTYTSATSYSEVGTITIPAKGYAIIYFGSYNSGVAVSKVGILPVVSSGNKTGVVSNVAHSTSPAAIGVTLCDYLEAGTVVKFYAQCASSGKRNTAYYRYVLIED